MKDPIVRRVEIRNYKSIARACLDFSPITLLVGRNGAGKSNLLDALRFTSDALAENLEFAIRHRGGIDEVRRKSLGSRPPNFHIQLLIQLPDDTDASYGFKVAPVAGGHFKVQDEVCLIGSAARPVAKFHVASGVLKDWPSGIGPAPAITEDRLFLGMVSGAPTFRPVWESLRRMVFHNLNPEEMKKPQRPETGESLGGDGRNLASVVKNLESRAPDVVRRVVSYLNAIDIPITEIRHQPIAGYDAIQFSQRTKKADKSWQFPASAMSDGTIRATGILLSLLSSTAGKGVGPTLVGVEEPETALHPAATGAILGAFLEAAGSTQIVLTCHSPDMIEQQDIDPSMIRVVITEDGETKVGPLSTQKTKLLSDHLASAGELLRLDQLTPDPRELEAQDAPRVTLWGTEE
ncbi:MAG: AAA family ATPase [Phycisphaerae bacterium]|nr:AAA family ATPase [Phycisphaerae bacterium]